MLWTIWITNCLFKNFAWHSWELETSNFKNLFRIFPTQVIYFLITKVNLNRYKNKFRRKFRWNNDRQVYVVFRCVTSFNFPGLPSELCTKSAETVGVPYKEFCCEIVKIYTSTQSKLRPLKFSLSKVLSLSEVISFYLSLKFSLFSLCFSFSLWSSLSFSLWSSLPLKFSFSPWSSDPSFLRTRRNWWWSSVEKLCLPLESNIRVCFSTSKRIIATKILVNNKDGVHTV